MLAEQVKAQIRFEIALLERLFASYEDLLERATQASMTEPTLLEVTALASILHSFYNGLENIFLLIAKRVDQQTLTGERWHQTLLEQMAVATEKRAAPLKAETVESLKDYLAFRHFYRHSYSFFLDWQRLAILVKPLPDLWLRVRAELEEFLRESKA